MNNLHDGQVMLIAMKLHGTTEDHELVIARTYHCQPPENILDQLEEHNLQRCTACNFWCYSSEMSKFRGICQDCLG